ncbi:TetR/AcrR family transcriptional regulator [Streptomyces bobili]|uniref:TetR/AcrR family transcriptional regulator n=1 Tax=Streptomyces bobili TaxID=67280 RepID=UPI00342A7E7E
MGRPKQFDPHVVVEQAMQLFWSQGFNATTPQQLVDNLGVGKGSLYNTFGGKRELFNLTLRRYVDSQATALAELLDRPEPVKERLRQALRILAEMDLGDPGRRGCMAVNATAEFGRTDESVAALLQGMLDHTESTFQILIEEGQSAGQITTERDALPLASLLVTSLLGLRLMVRVEKDPDRLMRAIDAAIDIL